MNMMSLLLAANSSTTEKKEGLLLFCQGWSNILVALFATFVVGAYILLGILFYISEKAGKIGLVLVGIAYISAIISEFQEGHIGHGIIIILFMLLFNGGVMLAIYYFCGNSSEQKTENKAVEDKKTSHETVTVFEFNNSVNNGNNGQNKHSATSYETITEDDLKKVNGNNS